MIRTIRHAALLGVVGVCLAGFAAPQTLWSQGAESPVNHETPEPAHELLFKTINFLILVGGLGYVLRKPMADLFSSRSAAITKGLEEGRKALQDSQGRLAEVEAKLARLETEIAAFKDASLREADAERQRVQQASAAEAARIVEAARAQTETAVRTAKLELKSYAATKAIDLAEQMIRTRLDESVQRGLVTQFVATVEPQERKN